MGDETQFHGGRRHSREGLEFIGAPKRSKFRHVTTEADQKRVAAPASANELAFGPLEDDLFFPEADLLPVLEGSIVEETVAAATEDVDDPTSDIPESNIQRPSAKEDKARSHKRIKLFLSTLLTIAAIIVLIVSSMYIKHNQPLVTGEFRKKMGIPLYYLDSNAVFSVDKKSAAIDGANSFVFVLHEKKTSARFVISQQKIPDIVKEEAQYQQFLGDSDKYADFNSPIGKAYFTKPGSIGTDVSVVVKTPTTLLFIRGPGETSEQTWTSLLSYFKVAK